MATKPVIKKATCEWCDMILDLRPTLDPNRKYFCCDEHKEYERQLLIICANLPPPTGNAMYYFNLTERKDQ